MLIKNLASNYAGAIIAAILPIFSLPYFLKAVGTEHWGVVAILSMTVSFLGIIDAGFSQVLTREFSFEKIGNKKTLSTKFISFKTIYLLAAIVLAISIPLASYNAVQFWFNIKPQLFEEVQIAFIGAGFISALQIGSAPQRALLIGGGNHFVLNAVSICSNIIKHMAAVIAIIYFPSVYTIILFFILGALFEFLTRGFIAEREDDFSFRFGIVWLDIRPILPQMLTMSGAVAISLLALQSDRIIVSYMLPIKEFSVYSIASTISMGALQFIYPVMTTFSPNIFKNSNNPAVLNSISKKIAIIIITSAAICWVAFWKYGEALLLIWLSNTELVGFILTPVGFLLSGVTVNALYNICYMRWLAFSKTGLIFRMNVFSFLATIFIMPIMIKLYGINGAAAGWALVNISMFVVSMLLCFKTEVK